MTEQIVNRKAVDRAIHGKKKFTLRYVCQRLGACVRHCLGIDEKEQDVQHAVDDFKERMRDIKALKDHLQQQQDEAPERLSQLIIKVTHAADDPDGPSEFADAQALKEKVRLKLQKVHYDVRNFYKTDGVWQAIARHDSFEQVTLFFIIINAIWIAVDADHNDADILIEAHPIFQCAENIFCFYFSGEWLTRALAFRNVINGFVDFWFVFDGLMCGLMVMETWFFSLFVLLADLNIGGSMGSASVLRVAKLLRLSRLARMAKLVRVMPELFVMIKGLVAAARSVFFTLVLLLGLVAVFAIAFAQLSNETVVEEIFPNVPESMYILIVHGALKGPSGMLSTDRVAKRVSDLAWEAQGPLVGVGLTGLFFFFVVNGVAVSEREEMLVIHVGEQMEKVVALIDEDGGGTISRDEFMLILDCELAIEALQDVGVDVIGLVDFADFIFGDEDEQGSQPPVELTLPEFMSVVLQLRGSNNATVKDVVDLRKFLGFTFDGMIQRMENIEARSDQAIEYVNASMAQIQEVHAELKRRLVEGRPLIPPGQGDLKFRSMSSDSIASSKRSYSDSEGGSGGDTPARKKSIDKRASRVRFELKNRENGHTTVGVLPTIEEMPMHMPPTLEGLNGIRSPSRGGGGHRHHDELSGLWLPPTGYRSDDTCEDVMKLHVGMAASQVQESRPTYTKSLPSMTATAGLYHPSRSNGLPAPLTRRMPQQGAAWQVTNGLRHGNGFSQTGLRGPAGVPVPLPSLPHLAELKLPDDDASCTDRVNGRRARSAPAEDDWIRRKDTEEGARARGEKIAMLRRRLPAPIQTEPAAVLQSPRRGHHRENGFFAVDEGAMSWTVGPPARARSLSPSTASDGYMRTSFSSPAADAVVEMCPLMDDDFSDLQQPLTIPDAPQMWGTSQDQRINATGL
eukprot:TRINITY_DN1901_c0_g2_i1.p1 TRINITY_DN1901_c0_g2~~TRINITY_DN1901_c0_g2_i1.p1  ORF type:complete len:909 (-),score=169.99 TRINITY_DN1901_c0_g2_i1:312-3038(-)